MEGLGGWEGGMIKSDRSRDDMIGCFVEGGKGRGDSNEDIVRECELVGD